MRMDEIHVINKDFSETVCYYVIIINEIVRKAN